MNTPYRKITIPMYSLFNVFQEIRFQWKTIPSRSKYSFTEKKIYTYMHVKKHIMRTYALDNLSRKREREKILK